MAVQFVSLAFPSWGEKMLSNSSINPIVLNRMVSLRLDEVKGNFITTVGDMPDVITWEVMPK
jgi:hypothetical protein